MDTNEPNEIDLLDALSERVRAGEPIHVTGPFDEVQGKLHIAMLNRLLGRGLPVQVVYSLPVHVIAK